MITLDTLTDSFGAFLLIYCLMIPFVVNKKRTQELCLASFFVVVIVHMAIYVAIKLNLNLSDLL